MPWEKQWKMGQMLGPATRDTKMKLLASAWPNHNHCGHLGNEPADVRLLFLYVSLFLPFKEINLREKNLKMIIIYFQAIQTKTTKFIYSFVGTNKPNMARHLFTSLEFR